MVIYLEQKKNFNKIAGEQSFYMGYELPKLDYAYNAVEPYIDAATMEIHHTKHYAAYINNANKAMEEIGYVPPKDVFDLLKNLNAVPELIRKTVRNNAGGHANHSFFWQTLGIEAKKEPSGKLLEGLMEKFGSFSSFKEKLTAIAAAHFASGWAWLYVKPDHQLAICSTPYHDSPWMKGLVDCEGTPLLVLDLWEHAYYLRYQNRRADYINAFWNIISWSTIEKRFLEAMTE